jgi:hypothetical protein
VGAVRRVRRRPHDDGRHRMGTRVLPPLPLRVRPCG